MTRAIGDRITLIKDTFQCARKSFESEPDGNKVSEFLIKTENEFKGVSYEGISMSIAIDSIEKRGTLDQWYESIQTFDNRYSSHTIIGLGWALARLSVNPKTIIERLEIEDQWRLFDGWGFHDGMFKRRNTFIKKELPAEIPQEYLAAYDFGLGRQVWYIHHSDLNAMHDFVNEFPAERRGGIWQGIGVAAAYVGGVDFENWKTILINAGKYISNVKTGIGVIAYGRYKTNSVDEFVKLSSRCVVGVNYQELALKVQDCRPETSKSGSDYFNEWFKNIKDFVSRS